MQYASMYFKKEKNSIYMFIYSYKHERNMARYMPQQSGCLRRLYKQLRKEEKQRPKKKGKDIQLNAGFQRIDRRNKKAFLSEQCKEIEVNNRMGKTRDLFKKTGDTKGTFHAKIGIIKDRNSMNLTEAEEIKKWWQEYIEERYKKILMT